MTIYETKPISEIPSVANFDKMPPHMNREDFNAMVWANTSSLEEMVTFLGVAGQTCYMYLSNDNVVACDIGNGESPINEWIGCGWYYANEKMAKGIVIGY